MAKKKTKKVGITMLQPCTEWVVTSAIPVNGWNAPFKQDPTNPDRYDVDLSLLNPHIIRVLTPGTAFTVVGKAYSHYYVKHKLIPIQVVGERDNTLYIPFPDIKDRVQPGPDNGAYYIIDANNQQYWHNFEWVHTNGRGNYIEKWDSAPPGWSYPTSGSARQNALHMTPAILQGHTNLIVGPAVNGYYFNHERMVQRDLAIAKHHLLTDDLLDVLPLFV